MQYYMKGIKNNFELLQKSVNCTPRVRDKVTKKAENKRQFKNKRF